MASFCYKGSIQGFFLASRDRYVLKRPIKTPAGMNVIPGHLEKDAFIMRLTTRGVARYDEIRKFWDINEVLRANEHLDIQDDIEWLASKEAYQKSKR